MLLESKTACSLLHVRVEIGMTHQFNLNIVLD
jgi:hypothetical protein